MKLDYLEMLHAEFEVSSLNSMAVREIIRWAKKICDGQRTTTDNNNGRHRQTEQFALSRTRTDSYNSENNKVLLNLLFRFQNNDIKN